mgnify:CR=1 FL=1
MAYREELTEADARAVLEAAGIPTTQVRITHGFATAWIVPEQAWRDLKAGRKVTPIDYDGVKGRLERAGAHLHLYSIVKQRTVIQYRVLEAA